MMNSHSEGDSSLDDAIVTSAGIGMGGVMSICTGLEFLGLCCLCERVKRPRQPDGDRLRPRFVPVNRIIPIQF